MRIAQDTPDRLVLKDRKQWISAICAPIGLLLAVVTAVTPSWGAGIGAALFLMGAVVFFDSADLVMDRVQRVCDLRRMAFGRTRRFTIRFDDITETRLERGTGGRNGPTFRLVFVTGGGIIPLTATLEGGESRYDAMLQRVREVLGSPAAAAPAPPSPPPPPMPQPDIVLPG